MGGIGGLSGSKQKSKTKSSSQSASEQGAGFDIRQLAGGDTLALLRNATTNRMAGLDQLPTQQNLSRFGLTQGQQSLFDNAIGQGTKDFFGQNSALAALAGRSSPTAIGDLVASSAGQAFTKLAPQALTLSGDNSRVNLLNPFQQGLGTLDRQLQAGGILAQLAGSGGTAKSKSKSKGKSSGFSFGAQGSGGSAGTLV